MLSEEAPSNRTPIHPSNQQTTTYGKRDKSKSRSVAKGEDRQQLQDIPLRLYRGRCRDRRRLHNLSFCEHPQRNTHGQEQQDTPGSGDRSTAAGLQLPRREERAHYGRQQHRPRERGNQPCHPHRRPDSDRQQKLPHGRCSHQPRHQGGQCVRVRLRHQDCRRLRDWQRSNLQLKRDRKCGHPCGQWRHDTGRNNILERRSSIYHSWRTACGIRWREPHNLLGLRHLRQGAEAHQQCLPPGVPRTDRRVRCLPTDRRAGARV